MIEPKPPLPASGPAVDAVPVAGGPDGGPENRPAPSGAETGNRIGRWSAGEARPPTSLGARRGRGHAPQNLPLPPACGPTSLARGGVRHSPLAPPRRSIPVSGSETGDGQRGEGAIRAPQIS